MKPGDSLGPYRVVSELGAGGMGEVYRAKDLTLDRDVAIKILPDVFAHDSERVARFTREAKTLASLNHPNIAQIYGILEEGEEQHVHALVMELVEGDDLSVLIARGAMPLAEALPIARQIADALEAAHEQGIIHRDLKPANIKVRADGTVKVLDFGLAKALDPAGSSGADAGAVANSPTMTARATQMGLIIGTAAYMAPEQAKGKSVDRRADIWAFGVVLYEMLTGRRAYHADDVSDTLAAVLTRDVDWSAIPAGTPPRLRRLLERCLERDAKLRLRDIGEARVELSRLATGQGEPLPPGLDLPVAAVTRAWWRGPMGVVAGLALGVAVGALAYRAAAGPPDDPSSARVIRGTLTGPKGAELVVEDRPLALSPDGTEIVVAARTPGAPARSLFVRTLSRVDWRELPDTSDATYPVWSPDGRSIAFFAGGKLKRIDVADGIVRVLCDAPSGRGADWSPKGFIVFAPAAVGGLSQVSESGGLPAVYSPPVTPGETQRMPHLLPDGRRVIHFSDFRTPVGLYVYDPDRKTSTLLMPSASEARYVAPGYLAYVRDENVVVQPFNAETLAFTGEARPIAAGAHFNVTRWFANFDVTATGVLVYQLVQRSPGDAIAWMDRTGAETVIPVAPGNIADLDVSRDGTRVLVNVIDDHTRSDVSVIDMARGVVTPFHLKAYSDYPRLIDRDRRVTFEQSAPAGQALMVTDLAGGNAKSLAAGDGMEYQAGGTSADGRMLVFSQRKNTDKMGDLMVLALAGGGPPTPLLATPDNEFSPRLSPRGDLVAYLTGDGEVDAPGMRAQLGVVAFPVAGEHPQATTTGLACRECWGWLSDRELFWQDAARRVWSVAVSARDGRVDIAAPVALFGGKALDQGVRVKAYSIDRQRFVVTRPAGVPPPVELAIVSDWRALLDGAKK